MTKQILNKAEGIIQQSFFVSVEVWTQTIGII